MRFLARPRLLDVIVALMEKAGKPLGRETLVRTLLAQGGSSRQVRYSIQGTCAAGA
jgi:DNA-binding winged helix-turn-helix (wHTH) protein